MRAVLCTRPCDWDELELTDVEPPPMRPLGVRIAIEVASVSFAMSLQVAGKYQRTYPLPFVPGTEVGGTVLEVAEGVTQVRPGDRVLAMIDWGGLAGQVVTPVHTVWPVPEGLPLDPGIHLPNAFGTAYGALDWRGSLQPGETLVVTGAAGAVGSAAVQLGRAMGAIVIAVASNADKQAFALAQGAQHACGYDTMRETIARVTGGRGADVVCDPVGGDAFEPALRSLAPFGRHVVVGFAAGRIPQVPANLLLVKNVSAIGHNMGLYFGWSPVDERAKWEPKMRAMMDRLFAWTLAGRLTPHVGHRYRLEQFREAMATVRGRMAQGKVVIRPND